MNVWGFAQTELHRWSVKGFVSLAKEINSNITFTHCFLHREILAVKTLPEKLNEVLNDVTSMVNFIKMRPLKSRIFKQLCQAMEANYECLLLHTEVRWLSRGKVLNRVLQLKNELLVFFETENLEKYSKLLKNDNWCNILAYLADLFAFLNTINTSMQGRQENILTSTDKLCAMKKKILLWKTRITEDNIEMFPSMHEIDEPMVSLIKEHLSKIEENFEKYFPFLNTEQYDWIRNPFVSSDVSALNINEEEELILLSSDRGLRLKRNEMSSEEFWISLEKEYPLIAKNAINKLLLFSTSYLCEVGFSTLLNIKTKKRTRIGNLEEEMRVALSTIRPNIPEICKEHQAHVSH